MNLKFFGLALILTACSAAPSPSSSQVADLVQPSPSVNGTRLVCKTGREGVFDTFNDVEKVYEPDGTFHGRVVYEGTKIVPYNMMCHFETRKKNKITSHSDWFVTQE